MRQNCIQRMNAILANSWKRFSRSIRNSLNIPVSFIRYRFSQEIIEKLQELKWWDLPEEKLKEHIALFQQENITVEELEKHFRNNEQE